MWRKRNPFVLLVGVQIGAATVESSVQIRQKLKMDLPLDPVIPLLEIYLKESKTLIRKNRNTPMFIAELCTIIKIWKQPKCTSVDEWIKQLWVIYRVEFYSVIKKEENFTLCNCMDGSGEHYAK